MSTRPLSEEKSSCISSNGLNGLWSLIIHQPTPINSVSWTPLQDFSEIALGVANKKATQSWCLAPSLSPFPHRNNFYVHTSEPYKPKLLKKRDSNFHAIYILCKLACFPFIYNVSNTWKLICPWLILSPSVLLYSVSTHNHFITWCVFQRNKH